VGNVEQAAFPAVSGGNLRRTGETLPFLPRSRARRYAKPALQFDINKSFTIAGNVAKVEWINPHSYLTVNVKDADGKVEKWAFVTRVETRSDNPSLAALATQTDYSNYADRAEVLTDIKTPGRIVRKQATRTVLDIEVKTWETNNPYLVFPVPRAVQLGLKLRN